MKRRRLSTTAAIWVLGLATISAAFPGIADSSTAAQGIAQASFGGITFSYDRSLASDVRGETVASNVGQGGLFSDTRPEHISFTFDGYPSKGLRTPRIRVIPLAAYKAAQAGFGGSAEFDALQEYLGGETGVPLPKLPPVNEVRNISENVARVAGAGVLGVRFIAAYSQGIVPVGAGDISYVFIGLTADRTYYVEATFPVSLATPLDAAPSPLTPENVQAYNRAVAARLGQTDTSGFNPTLDKLDKMMSSVQVNAPPIPGMPTTGGDATQYEGVTLAVLSLAMLLILAGLGMSLRAAASRVR